MSHWLDKILPTIRNTTKRKNTIPEGLWRKCPKCEAVLYKPELERALNVCTKCQHHLRVNARKRADMVLDAEGREELGGQIAPVDKLKFRDSKRYKDRLNQAEKSTGEKDALVTLRGQLAGQPVVVAIFEFEFMGGSMGSVVGEKFVQAANLCLEEQIPFICFSASGGARMQEALFSLMQMAKTGAVLKKLKQAGIPYISVMTDPVYGGVSASLAMLGDINIAEPNALIGFAGPRVIEQTVRQKLPEGFQRSEFLLEHGVLDMIVHRQELKKTLANLLSMLAYKLPSYLALQEQAQRESVQDDAKSDLKEEGTLNGQQAELTDSAEGQNEGQKAQGSQERAAQSEESTEQEGALHSTASKEEIDEQTPKAPSGESPTDSALGMDSMDSGEAIKDGESGAGGVDGEGATESDKVKTGEPNQTTVHNQTVNNQTVNNQTATESAKASGKTSETGSDKNDMAPDSVLDTADQTVSEPESEEKRSFQ